MKLTKSEFLGSIGVKCIYEDAITIHDKSNQESLHEGPNACIPYCLKVESLSIDPQQVDPEEQENTCIVPLPAIVKTEKPYFEPSVPIEIRHERTQCSLMQISCQPENTQNKNVFPLPMRIKTEKSCFKVSEPMKTEHIDIPHSLVPIQHLLVPISRVADDNITNDVNKEFETNPGFIKEEEATIEHPNTVQTKQVYQNNYIHGHPLEQLGSWESEPDPLKCSYCNIQLSTISQRILHEIGLHMEK